MNSRNLAEALGRFALAHPTRPLSDVTVREFADWYDGTREPVQVPEGAHTEIKLDVFDVVRSD